MTQEEIIERVRFYSKLRGLSKHTEEMYVVKATVFQRYYGKPATELGLTDIKNFLYYLLTEKKLCPGAINTYNSGLRFLYQIVLDRPLETTKIPCLKKKRTIPNILTKDEVGKLLTVTKNSRDKALLATIYGAGLRVSEAVALKISDVDSRNMQLLIRNGKGGKDRFAILSAANLRLLRTYGRNTGHRNFFLPAATRPVHTYRHGEQITSFSSLWQLPILQDTLPHIPSVIPLPPIFWRVA